ncbi:MAG: hypothetical protein DMG07_06025, partial [Acidobacteria bacterium]
MARPRRRLPLPARRRRRVGRPARARPGARAARRARRQDHGRVCRARARSGDRHDDLDGRQRSDGPAARRGPRARRRIVKRLEGVIPALVTPFRADGRVDGTALAAQIDFQLATGVDALLVLGG